MPKLGPLGPFNFAPPGSLFWNHTEPQPTLYYVLSDGSCWWVLQLAVNETEGVKAYGLRRNSLHPEMIDGGFQIEDNNLIKLVP